MKKSLILFFCIVVVLIGSGYFWAFFLVKPTAEIGIITLLGKDGDIIRQIRGKDGKSLPYAGSIDLPIVSGIIQVEDKRYWKHHGTDILAKLSTLRDRLLYDSDRGGSTLTEQYVKNIYFPGASRTIFQKIRETLVAQSLETRETKEKILRNYLDTVYMGNGIYGITLAIETYFWKSDPAALTREEIIELITRIHSPNLTGQTASYEKRVSMELFGSEVHPAPHVPISPWEKIGDRYTLLQNRILWERADFCSQKSNQLSEFLTEISPTICTDRYVTLRTTIDTRLSDFSQNVLDSTIVPLLAKNLTNGAIFIRENTTGKVLVSIGSRSGNMTDGQIDMTRKRRSVGSVLKPFVYALAIQDGADGESLLLDDQHIYETGDGEKKYVPENYTTKSYGIVRLKEALGNSLNSATVRLSEKLGIGRVADFYKKNGLDLNHEASYYGYGISLGSVELTPENIVRGYSRLADLSNAENFLIFTILSNSANRSKTFWVSSILNTQVPMAVKTWTSTDFRDNWVIGYTSEYTIGVWVGNADGSSMQDVSGVSGAGPIFHKIAEKMIALGYIKNQEPAPPEDIEESFACLDIGCFQKERTFIRSGILHESRPQNGLFFQSDFFHDLTEEEKEKWKIQ